MPARILILLTNQGHQRLLLIVSHSVSLTMSPASHADKITATLECFGAVSGCTYFMSPKLSGTSQIDRGMKIL